MSAQSSPAPAAPRHLIALRDRWSEAWPTALALWSRFTKLSEPRWCLSADDAKREGLSGSFAMIRLTDQAVLIGLDHIAEKRLDAFAVEVLAHEIGHHVYCPGNLLDHGRMLARMRRGLPTLEHLAPLVANLYADLLINDRLQRVAGRNISGVYAALGDKSSDRLWTFYMRIYEILWAIPRGTLAGGKIDARMEGDAQLGARLIRSYSEDWLAGAGRFAALILEYLRKDQAKTVIRILGGLLDIRNVGGGGDVPAGLAGIDDGELDGARHPALDDEDAGDATADPKGDRTGPARGSRSAGGAGGPGQYREPFEYGEILRALGLDISEEDAAARYYRERAAPHLVRFPVRVMPESADPLPEGLETWDIGGRLEEVDWLATVITSPRVIPGVTTVQRVTGTAAGAEPEKRPIDLDLYVDCSGSMPDPRRHTSYLTLAGAIVALSALRVGSRVQATLWSGVREVLTTGGFVSDPVAILRVFTGYFGGGTAFPIHVLRDTYAARRPTDRAVHILNISDDGVTTMFDRDEKGNSGWDVSAAALKAARGGATMVLNLYQTWEKNKDLVRAADQGWSIHVVRDWADLEAFAREFSRANYGPERRPARATPVVARE
jgi:hypothetical protein